MSHGRRTDTGRTDTGGTDTGRTDTAPAGAGTGGQTVAIEVAGPFSLAESARFEFGPRLEPTWDGCLRMAFCTDGGGGQAGVVLRQDGQRLVAELSPGADPGAVARQVARVLSVDHDATAFVAVGDRDPVVGRLQAVAPGLRPPLFHSPYEAAAWCVLSARRPARRMAAVRQRLSEAHGATFTLAGQRVPAFPTPAQLLAVPGFPDVPDETLDRLHGVARAAAEGRLDATRLRATEPGRAQAELQAIKGIGPFYSSLIALRAVGWTDLLPVGEPRLGQLVARLYGLQAPPSEAQLIELAEPWRPFRTWTAVLIRAAAGRLLDGGRPTARLR